MAGKSKTKAKKAAPKKAVKSSKGGKVKAKTSSKSTAAAIGLMARDQFLASCLDEIRIIKHIATKILADQFEYRPTPVQRTMTELLRYLTTCATVPGLNMRDGNWDAAEPVEKASEALDVREGFAAAMDEQARQLKQIVNKFSDADFHALERQMPWGAPCKLGEGLVNTVLKPLVAYRMQLFLYVKASGRHDLGPAQCWVGVDPKPRPEQPEA